LADTPSRGRVPLGEATSRAAEPFEAVEHEVETERELALVLGVARPQVLMDVFDEVWQFVDRELLEEARR
jgi:hypothetical protein